MQWHELLEEILTRSLGMFIVAVTIAVALRLRQSRIQRIKSLSWPHTTGIIEGRSTRKSKGGEGGPSFFPEVTYRYRVNQAEYVCDNWGYVGLEGSQTAEEANEQLPEFREGAEVRVYYDPQSPSDAVLLKEDSMPWIFIILGLTCMFIGGFFLAIGFRLSWIGL